MVGTGRIRGWELWSRHRVGRLNIALIFAAVLIADVLSCQSSMQPTSTDFIAVCMFSFSCCLPQTLAKHLTVLLMKRVVCLKCFKRCTCVTRHVKKMAAKVRERIERERENRERELRKRVKIYCVPYFLD